MTIERFEPIRVERAWTRKTFVTRSLSNFTSGASKVSVPPTDLPPVQFNDDAFEGLLARDPSDPEVWGIACNGTVSPQRQRFTIAHELGHFILHRDRQPRFHR